MSITVQGRPVRLQLAESWSVFAKALAIYPPTNSRIRDSLDRLMTLYGQVMAEEHEKGAARVQLLFASDTARIGGEDYAIEEGSNLAWLRDRITGTALLGIEMEGAPESRHVVAFTRMLLDNYGDTPGQSFDQLWSMPIPGIEPIERRFQGAFGARGGGIFSYVEGSQSTSERQELIDILSADDEVLSRLATLRETVAPDEAMPNVEIDLVTRIVELLPLDVLNDVPRVVWLTTEVLQSVANQLNDDRGLTAEFFDDERLERMMFVVAQRLFGRQGFGFSAEAEEGDEEASGDGAGEPGGEGPAGAPGERAGSGKPKAQKHKGRGRDDEIGEDVDALLAEVALLPEPANPHVLLAELELPEEQLGIYLHFLANPDSTAGWDQPRADLLERLRTPGQAELEVLGEYMELFRSKDGGATQRLLGLLRSAGLAPVLRARGIVNAATIAETFPGGFGLYMDCLDLELESDLEELGTICATVGDERIVAAAEYLVETEGLLEHGRARRILQHPHVATQSLAFLVLKFGGETYRGDVVAFLRHLAPDFSEACLLWIAADMEYFPREYLLGLLDPFPDRRQVERLWHWVSMMLCRFVRNPGNEDSRRVYAIKLLPDFWTSEVEKLLRKIAGGSGLLARKAPEGSVKQAAREALDTYGIG